MIFNKVLAAVAALAVSSFAMAGPLPELQPDGTRMVDPSGNEVTLRGCNLGTWFLIEVWMIAQSWEEPTDQWGIEQVLIERFGEDEKDRLMEIHRENWITESDFDIIRSFNFNVVRLPFWYTLLSPEEGVINEEGFEWLDRAIDMAESRGIYTILDMHGVPGGQTTEHHTGRGGQNEFWDSQENQDHWAWLWGEIAERYNDRSAVVAYDLINEPWGAPPDGQPEIFERGYREVREHDPDTVVLFHGHWGGFEYFGNPHEQGLHNVGYQMHYYPGLFGSPTTFRSHRGHLDSLASTAELTEEWGVPFLVGEMNVVFDKFGGEMMRRYYDLHESYGWWTTMWSYKVLNQGGGNVDSWGMVSNADPLEPIDWRTASLEEIEARLRSWSTMEMSVDEDLRGWLAPPERTAPLEFELEPVRERAPQGTLPGWTMTDVNEARTGGFVQLGNGGFVLYGGGEDIWNTSDQFRFMSAEANGDFSIEVRVDEHEDLGQYPKAGLMVRSSLAADSPSLLLSVFPSGNIQVAYRAEAGAETTATVDIEDGSGIGALLRLERIGDEFIASVDGAEVERIEWENAPDSMQVGPVALSHSNDQLIRIFYSDLTFNP